MIHVLFCSSAAGTLRQVLSARGKRERVVDLTEWLDWGPIALNDFEEREAWLDHHIPWGDGRWDWIASGPQKFQSKIEKDPDRLIWIAPRSASEQCGLYWYLDRFGGDGASMIVADYPLPGAWRGQSPFALGELRDEEIGALLDQANRELWNPSRFPQSRWRNLCEEASLLRIVEQGTIKSAPAELFDSHLLARCPQTWQKLYRVVGETMVSLWDEGHRVDSTFLTWRLRVLAGQGKIVTTGEIIAFPQPDEILIRSAEQ